MRLYKSALVLGLGASGEAAARLLLAEGAKVVVSDRGNSETLRQRAATLRELGAVVNLGSALPVGEFEVAIVSPGIPVASPALKAVRERGIPLVSELELGWSRLARGLRLDVHSPRRSALAEPGRGFNGRGCRVLAISGSNGKSTLVKLCAEALELAGQRTAIAGNYGLPVSAVAREGRRLEWLVLEVSSFQLETVQAFHPDVGVLLNVTPNHLDRHGDFATYQALKARLFARMTAADAGVVEMAILPEIKSLARSPNRWIAVGVNNPAADFFYQGGAIHNSISGESVEIGGTMFDNEIMGLTAAAATAALTCCGVAARRLAAAARSFQSLPHRLQDLGIKRGVRFVDDSKATNLAAMMAALTVTPGLIRLIAGGLPKGESYEPAKDLLAKKVAGVYLIGQAAEAMRLAWQEVVACGAYGALPQAVAAVWKEARPGETVLLSPACASFDQFHSFEERGECFQRLIQTLEINLTPSGG